MRAADGIEPGFFQDAHAAVLGSFQSRRADDAVVVMDARPAQADLFSVDFESLRRGNGERADPEARLLRIDSSAVLPQRRFERVQRRGLSAPQFGRSDKEGVFSALRHFLPCGAEDFKGSLPSRRFDRNGELGCFGIGSHGRDPHSVGMDMHLVRHEEIDGAIDARPRIPAAVVARRADDLEHVLLLKLQILRKIGRKLRVAVSVLSDKVAVEIDERLIVHTFEL